MCILHSCLCIYVQVVLKHVTAQSLNWSDFAGVHCLPSVSCEWDLSAISRGIVLQRWSKWRYIEKTSINEKSALINHSPQGLFPIIHKKKKSNKIADKVSNYMRRICSIFYFDCIVFFCLYFIEGGCHGLVLSSVCGRLNTVKHSILSSNLRLKA